MAQLTGDHEWIDMANRLHRDLVTLRDLLQESRGWRLTPDEWQQATQAINDLVGALTGQDGHGIDDVLTKFELIEPGSRTVTSINDPRLVSAPEQFRARTIELVPVIVEQIERTGGKGRRRDAQQSGEDVH